MSDARIGADSANPNGYDDPKWVGVRAGDRHANALHHFPAGLRGLPFGAVEGVDLDKIFARPHPTASGWRNSTEENYLRANPPPAVFTLRDTAEARAFIRRVKKVVVGQNLRNVAYDAIVGSDIHHALGAESQLHSDYTENDSNAGVLLRQASYYSINLEVVTREGAQRLLDNPGVAIRPGVYVFYQKGVAPFLIIHNRAGDIVSSGSVSGHRLFLDLASLAEGNNYVATVNGGHTSLQEVAEKMVGILNMSGGPIQLVRGGIPFADIPHGGHWVDPVDKVLPASVIKVAAAPTQEETDQ